MPGRMHITWQDDNTLKVETDTGQQTRLFHFGEPRKRRPASRRGKDIQRRSGNTPGGRGARGPEAQADRSK